MDKRLLDQALEILRGSGLLREDVSLWESRLIAGGDVATEWFLEVFTDNIELLYEATENLRLKIETLDNLDNLDNPDVLQKVVDQEHEMLAGKI